MPEIAVLVYDRITALDAVGPYEVLQRWPDAQLRWVAREPGVVHTDEGKLALVADSGLDEVTQPDVIVVPGGFGTDAVLEDERVLEWLRHAHETSRWTTSVCTGSLVLGAAGLLEGPHAQPRTGARWTCSRRTTTPTPTGAAGRRAPRRAQVITAAGVSSGIDMALRPERAREFVDRSSRPRRMQLMHRVRPAAALRHRVAGEGPGGDPRAGATAAGGHADVRSPSGPAAAGIGYALAAYTIWGVAPVYWKAMQAVPAAELLGHRVLWSVGIGALLLTATGAWPAVRAVLRSPRALATILLTAALQVRESMPECISIFILPPSVTELERRLRARNTDSEEVIERRLRDALSDMSHWDEFDHVIINDDLNRAINDLEDVLTGNGEASSTQNADLRQAVAAVFEGR